ncbi:MAG: amidohydrolase family protein [Pseudomonadales bacterium]|nr:amidohydrolase family protein [Pseudomonadales bacterium]
MAKDVLLSNCRLIDGILDQPRDHMSILIRGDRIVEIIDGSGPSGGSIDVLDCTGKTVMPGLIDSHVHATLMGEEDLSLFLATGVTTARDVGGKLEKVLALRQRLKLGEVLGPRLYVFGPLLDGPGKSFGTGALTEILDHVQSVEEAPGKVQSLIDAGVDGIKLYFTLPPDIAKALLLAVDRRVPTTGHLGHTTALEAISFGIEGLEHMWISPYNDICPREMCLGADASMASSAFWLDTIKGWEAADLKAPHAQKFVGAMVDHQINMGTTLDLLWTAKSGLEGAMADPDRAHIPQQNIKRQQAMAKRAGFGEEWDIHPGFFPPGHGLAALEKQQEAVRLLHEAGGIVIGGTDCGALGYPPPGFALLREVELLAEAIGNMAALKAVTAAAANALRLGHELGAIAPGFCADLLVLDENPLDDVKALRSLNRVIRGGESYDAKQLLAQHPSRNLKELQIPQ